MQKTVYLTSMECCICWIPFAIPRELDDKYQRQGGDWYCPNGHCQQYIQTREMKLRAKLDQAEAEILDLRTENKTLKTRTNYGVCPHCNRYFANVHRHIKYKHKDKLQK